MPPMKWHPERILVAVVAGCLVLAALLLAAGQKIIATWIFGFGVALAFLPLIGAMVYQTYEKITRR